MSHCSDGSNRQAGSRPEASDMSFVADGEDRLVRSVISRARALVEEKYADEWNRSGFLRRWKLQRAMKKEIEELVSQELPDVAPESLF